MTELDAIRGWVLDLDDTLYLERDYVRSGFAALGRWMGETRGIVGFEGVANAHFARGARGNIFNLALADLGADEALVSTLVDLYREHSPDIRLAADASEFLGSLKGRMPLGIVSDGPFASQSRKITALGLDAVASPVILTEQHGRDFHKPSTRAFHEIEAAWGLSGRSLVYVADNPEKDFQGPHALGWQTIRIVRQDGIHSGQPSPEGLVSLHITSFDALSG